METFNICFWAFKIPTSVDNPGNCEIYSVIRFIIAQSMKVAEINHVISKVMGKTLWVMNWYGNEL